LINVEILNYLVNLYTFNVKRASLRLENNVNSGNVDLSEIKEIIIQLRESFQNFKDDTCNNFDNLNSKLSAIDNIITENKILKTQIILLENKIESIERRQIANDIIIDGVPENKSENCSSLIQKIGKELNLNINTTIWSTVVIELVSTVIMYVLEEY